MQTCPSVLSRIVQLYDPGSVAQWPKAWSHLFELIDHAVHHYSQLIVQGANIPAGQDLLIDVIVFHTHCMIYYSNDRKWLFWIKASIRLCTLVSFWYFSSKNDLFGVFARQLDNIFTFVIMSHCTMRLCRPLLSFCCPAWTRCRVRVDVRVLQYTMWPAGCAIGLTECHLKGFPFILWLRSKYLFYDDIVKTSDLCVIYIYKGWCIFLLIFLYWEGNLGFCISPSSGTARYSIPTLRKAHLSFWIFGFQMKINVNCSCLIKKCVYWSDH